jgi:hypothetical protein
MPAHPEEDPDALKKALEGIGTDRPRREIIKEALTAHRAAAKGRTPEQDAAVAEALRALIEKKRERDAERDHELLEAAIEWLKDRWGSQPCPYCQQTEWQVGTPLEIAVGKDGAMSPAFPVMCGNCGHTTFVNAVVSGLLPEPDMPAGTLPPDDTTNDQT